MTTFGSGLVPATKRGPGEPKAPALSWLIQRQQEAPDLRGSDRDQLVVCCPPFCASLAAQRVTSR
jgi:hypothetical protein